MKIVTKTIALTILLSTAFLFSCKKDKDEKDELSLDFKMSTGYTFSSETIMADSSVTIGIIGKTIKEKDPIIRFNISESVNGATPVTVYNESFSQTYYDHDYQFKMDTVSGSKHHYTFTITNKDGKIKQSDILLTVE